jgi:regulator of RNase E activity RraA
MKHKEEKDIQKRIIDLIETNKISTTEVADALGKSGHIPDVLPINKNHHVVGKVRLIYNYDGTNWPLHDGIQSVNEGEVVYIHCDNCENLAIFGDLVSKYLMLYKRCKAIVCNGLVRDVHRIIKENYPIWSTGRSPIGCSNNKPEKNKYLSNKKIKKYKDGVIVCDDTGVVLIESHQLTQELYNRLKVIELQEDVWYYCLDTKKQSTFEIVCEKKYLLPDNNFLINDNIDKLKNML